MAALSQREMRCLFTRLICQLGVWIFEQPGMEVAFNEVVRTEAQAKVNAASGAGISRSLHLDGLACDFNLYINGQYQSDSLAHQRIGDKWRSMHPLCRWGGDFRDSSGRPKPDGNHYSLEWQGRK